MSRYARSVWGCGWIVALACWQAVAPAQQANPAQPANDSQQALIELIDDDSPTALAVAESLYGQLTKDGAANVRGGYALALLCAREGQLDRAVEVLGSLPNEVKLSGPVLRLRLWLALERDEKEMAPRVLKLLREQIAAAKLPEAERLEAVRLLGGIAGALADGNAPALPKDEIAATVKELSSAADQKASSTFRSAQQAAQKRRLQLAALVAEIGADKEGGAKRLTDAEAEKANLDQAIKDAEAGLTATIVENRAEGKEKATELKKLTGNAKALKQEWNQRTPGEPRVPLAPQQPRQPRQPTADSKGNISATARSNYDREMRQYQDEVLTYRVRLKQYEQDARDYPAKIAAWQQLDKARRDGLKAQLAQVEGDQAAARGDAKARTAEAEKARQDLAVKKAESRDLDLKIRLLKTALAAPGADAGSAVLTRPSSYDLISYSAEKQRLLRAGQ